MRVPLRFPTSLRYRFSHSLPANKNAASLNRGAGCVASRILIFRNANDLAVNQMLKINIGICRHNGRRADTQFIRNSVERIARHDSIAPCVCSAAVEGHAEIGPCLQAPWIETWILIQNALNADIEVPCYVGNGVTPLNAVCEMARRSFRSRRDGRG